MFPSQFANIFLRYQTFVTNLHQLRAELRCKLQEKLHRVTGPLRFNVTNLSINLFAFKQNGGTAVQAVEQAVRVFEEHGHFNAGRGSCLNTSGEVECDALIMDGHEMKTGRYTVRRKPPKCYCKVVYCCLRYELDIYFRHLF